MSVKPKFLLDEPKPHLKQRLYNGRKLVVWEGKVNIASIDGWIDNPRIDLAKKALQDKVGPRDLTQEEIFDLMKNDAEVELKELRDDILKNGLREPLTLSYKGKLLDGNRRFFAVKFALETMPPSDPNRQDLETVPAFVLYEEASSEDEENVLVEENFSASLKIEWPDYIKAQKVIEAYEKGLSVKQIAKKFAWKPGKVTETIRINEIIGDFEIYATNAPDFEDDLGGGLGLSVQEAQILAASNYQFFNEAQKSFFEPMKSDIEFKTQFFKWLSEKKFTSWPDVRVAYRAWKDPEARAAIMQPEPGAAKAAKAIIDYNMRISRSTEEAAGRIETFVKFLKDMTADEIKQIPDQTREKLEEALKMVAKMSRAASEK